MKTSDQSRGDRCCWHFLMLDAVSNGAAAAQGGRRRVEERGQVRRRVALLRPDAGRDALQSAEADRCHQCEPARLGVVLRDFFGGGGNQEATPLVWNSTIYGITNWSIVFAVDARTGKEKWRWDPEVNQDKRPLQDLLRRRESRPRAVQRQDHRAGHRRAAGGARCDDRQAGVGSARVLSAGQLHAHHGSAHRQGKSDHRRGGRGSSDARLFRRLTMRRPGRFAWRFYTVPGDPSKPFENEAMRKAAATWDGDVVEDSAAAARCGTAIAYDPEADLVYVGTGNAEPWPEDLRSGRKGKDNLYVASILARERRHGRAQVALPDGPRRRVGLRQRAADDPGRPDHQRASTRKVIMQANKNGFYYVLDRVTRRVHLRPAVRASHLGQGSERRDRPAHRQYGSALRRQRSVTVIARRRRRAQLVADVVQPEHGLGVHSDELEQFRHLFGVDHLQLRSHQVEFGRSVWRPGRRRRCGRGTRRSRGDR